MPKSFQIAQKLTAVIHEAEEGGYWAEVPALRGCYSQGDTLAETKANIREAAEGWLETQAEQEETPEEILTVPVHDDDRPLKKELVRALAKAAGLNLRQGETAAETRRGV